MDGSKKAGLLSVLAICAGGVKLMASFARENRRGENELLYNSYLRSDPYQNILKNDVYARRDEVRQAMQDSVELHCETSVRRPFLEPQGSLEPLVRAGYELSMPQDLKVPPTFTVLGLPVRVLVTDADFGERPCMDVSQAMVDGLARQRPAFSAKALEKIAPGAWLLTSEPHAEVPASAALTSATFLKELGPKSLIAFVPVDQTVAFADASNPAAIRAAAKRILKTVDPSSTDSFTEAAPLIFKDGVWSRWAPKQLTAELKDVQTLGEILETRVALEMISQDLDFEAELASDPKFSTRKAAVTNVFVSKAIVTKGLSTSVYFEPHEITIVGQADMVTMGIYDEPVTWAVFRRDHAAQISHVFIDGVLLPRVVKWTPE